MGGPKCLVDVVMLAPGDDPPADASNLVGQCHDRFVHATPGHHRVDPLGQRRALVARPADRGPGAMDQHGAQVTVAILAHPVKFQLAARTVLPRHQPKPSRDLTALLELMTVADRGEVS